MLNYFMDCSKNTPIGQLPTIINHNNAAVKDEFEWIFDSSANRLIRSVYAPTGSVKAYFGEFTNLSVEYLTVKNIESIKNSIKDTIKNSSHNDFGGRFNDASLETTSYMHDAASIYVDTNKSVADALVGLDASMSELRGLYTDVSALQTSVTALNTGLISTDASVVILRTDLEALDTSFTTDSSVIHADISILKQDVNYLDSQIQYLSNDIIKKTINIFYDDLLKAVDTSSLNPGQSYRIIDYVTKVNYADASSAEHQFDVIVTADTVSQLNAVARAVRHNGDTYFANTDFSKWEIRYDVSNNKTKYSWADASNGKGVIYYMKDEFNNECPYDFKNVLYTNFKRWNSAGTDSSVITDTEHYVYTFSSRASADCTDYSLDASTDVFSNVIKPYINNSKYNLNKIIFLGDNCYSNTFGESCCSNTFKGFCFSNTFGYDCNDNTFGYGCIDNTCGNNCCSNVFGGYCCSNTLGNNCCSNAFGSWCNYNTFGNRCYSNTFGNNCYSNTYESTCAHIKIISN